MPWKSSRMKSGAAWRALGRKMWQFQPNCWHANFITRAIPINWGQKEMSILLRLDLCNSRCFPTTWRCADNKLCICHEKQEELANFKNSRLFHSKWSMKYLVLLYIHTYIWSLNKIFWFFLYSSYKTSAIAECHWWKYEHMYGIDLMPAKGTLI